MKGKYRTTETTVYCCRYHVIFCPKYRRKVLINGIDERFKEIVLSMQEEQNFYVLEMEVMPDHVHLLLVKQYIKDQKVNESRRKKH